MAKLVSKTYGDALFELAKEENRIDEFFEQIQMLQSVLQENPDLAPLAQLNRRTFLPTEVNKIYQVLGQP